MTRKNWWNCGINRWIDFTENNGTDEVVEVLHSSVPSNFLALRSAPSFDDSNIIAEIYQNRAEFLMTGWYDDSYAYCYIPAFDMYGLTETDYTF